MNFATQTLDLSGLKSEMRHGRFNQMSSCIFALNSPLAARHLAFHGFFGAIMQMHINLASEKKKFKPLKFAPRFLNRMRIGRLHLVTDTKSTVVKNKTCIEASHLGLHRPVQIFNYNHLRANVSNDRTTRGKP